MDYDFDIGRPLNPKEAKFLDAARTRADRNEYLLHVCRKTYGAEPHLPGDFGFLPSITREQYRYFASKAHRAEFLYEEYAAIELLLVEQRQCSIAYLLEHLMSKGKYAFVKAVLARFVNQLASLGASHEYQEGLKKAAFDPKAIVQPGMCQTVPVPDEIIRPKATRHPEWARQPTPRIETGRQEQRENTLLRNGPDTTRVLLTQQQFDALMLRVPTDMKDMGAEEGARLRFIEDWVTSQIKRDRPLIDLVATRDLISRVKELLKQDEQNLLNTFE